MATTVFIRNALQASVGLSSVTVHLDVSSSSNLLTKATASWNQTPPRGFSFGFTGTLMHIYYWYLVSLFVKQAYTIKYDECSTIMNRTSHNSLHMCDTLGGKDLPVDEQESSAPAAFDLTSSALPFIKLKVLELHIR
jgi:hypothetical protein